MNESQKIIAIFSTTIFLLISLVVGGSIYFLHRTAVREQGIRLLEMTISRANLIEALVGEVRELSPVSTQPGGGGHQYVSADPEPACGRDCRRVATHGLFFGREK